MRNPAGRPFALEFALWFNFSREIFAFVNFYSFFKERFYLPSNCEIKGSDCGPFSECAHIKSSFAGREGEKYDYSIFRRSGKGLKSLSQSARRKKSSAIKFCNLEIALMLVKKSFKLSSAH